MRKVLFNIGCVLFFYGLLVFSVGTVGALFDRKFGFSLAKDINKNVYFTTVLFFVGTYLVTNNKPEDK